MKSQDELAEIIEEIRSPESPVGMNAVHVHAAILDQLSEIQARLEAIEAKLDETSGSD